MMFEMLKFKHRKHLDSIRGLACLLVILFHCGCHALSNGYVGVDVFFVLSGYLITSILLRELYNNDRIDLCKFYSRRFTRLFPASCVVLISTAIVYKFIELPEYTERHKNSFLWSSLYGQNWYALRIATDYFTEKGSDQSPVIHFWSLSIEEQFYFIYPLLLTVLWAVCRKNLNYLFFIFVVSFFITSAYNILLWYENPMISYFSTFGRVYQLLAGSVLAVVILLNETKNYFNLQPEQKESKIERVSDYLSGFLLLLMLFVVLFFTHINSLLLGQITVMGSFVIFTLLEISSVDGQVKTKFFENKIICFIGKISYGMYLCHVPITKFGDILGLQAGI